MLVCDGQLGLGQTDRARRRGPRDRPGQGDRLLHPGAAQFPPYRPDRPLGRAVRRGRARLHPHGQRGRRSRRSRLMADARRGSSPTRSRPASRARAQPPVIVDFATSKLAMGKVRVAYNKGVPVPADILLDREGEPTTDPGASVRGEPWRRDPALRRAQGLGPGAGLRADRRRPDRRRHHVRPRKRPAIINNMVSMVIVAGGDGRHGRAVQRRHGRRSSPGRAGRLRARADRADRRANRNSPPRAARRATASRSTPRRGSRSSRRARPWACRAHTSSPLPASPDRSPSMTFFRGTAAACGARRARPLRHADHLQCARTCRASRRATGFTVRPLVCPFPDLPPDRRLRPHGDDPLHGPVRSDDEGRARHASGLLRLCRLGSCARASA